MVTSVHRFTINIHANNLDQWTGISRLNNKNPNEILEISRDLEKSDWRDASNRWTKRVYFSASVRRGAWLVRTQWPWYARDSSGGFAEHASSSFQRIRFLAPASFLSFLTRDFPTGDDSTPRSGFRALALRGTTPVCGSVTKAPSLPQSRREIAFSSRRDKGRRVPRNELSRSLAAISSKRREYLLFFQRVDRFHAWMD